MAATARWSLLAKVPWTARSSHCLTATNAGLLVLYGGELKPRTPVDAAPSDSAAKDAVPKGSVHVFDLNAARNLKSKQTWQTLRRGTSALAQPLGVPDARVGATLVSEGGAFYLWGGRGGVDMAPLGQDQVGIWRGEVHGDHDARAVQWKRIEAANEEEAPEPRSYHASVSLNGKIYIHAGCPVSGRLSTLHSFDIAQQKWQSLAPAPEPVRGGTSLTAVTINSATDVLLRYGGFSGYELPDSAGTLDVYSIGDDKWHTVQPKPDHAHGSPGPRSVHGFVPFTSSSPSLEDAVALLYHGERDASTLGHAGAGTFWTDVWLLFKDNSAPETEGWAWKRVQVVGENAKGSAPEGRGWFPSASWIDGRGHTQVLMHGGLLSSNERSDELCLLDVV